MPSLVVGDLDSWRERSGIYHHNKLHHCFFRVGDGVAQFTFYYKPTKAEGQYVIQAMRERQVLKEWEVDAADKKAAAWVCLEAAHQHLQSLGLVGP